MSCAPKSIDGLRTSDWLDARRRLFESGLFRRVDISVEPLEGAADTRRQSRCVWSSRNGRHCGFATVSRSQKNAGRKRDGRDLVPGVSADLTRRTLFGRAITVGAAAQVERIERLGRLFVNTPTLLGRPVQSSLTLEQSRDENRTDTLVTNRTTAAWEQRGRWRTLTLSYGLRFERNRTFDTGEPIPSLVQST